jgi:hypothetical protein
LARQLIHESGGEAASPFKLFPTLFDTAQPHFASKPAAVFTEAADLALLSGLRAPRWPTIS